MCSTSTDHVESVIALGDGLVAVASETCLATELGKVVLGKATRKSLQAAGGDAIT